MERLEKAGFLESFWEDPQAAADEGRSRRRFYRVTLAGETALAKHRTDHASTPNLRPPAGHRMSGMRTMPRSAGFVRAWVRLYTAGLPPSLREARREEIDADLCEQAHQEAVELAPSLTTHVLFRWILGLPDDLLWRLAHLGARDPDTADNALIEAKSHRTLAIVTGAVATLLIAVLVALAVTMELEYQRQTDYGLIADADFVLSIACPVGLGSIIVGFRSMCRTPLVGAILVSFGSLALAVMFWWLIVPGLIAISLSIYAFRRARRIQSGE